MKLSETLATRAQHQMPVLETHADQARELEDTNAVLNDYINGHRPQGITDLGAALDKIKQVELDLEALYGDRRTLLYRLESESSRADFVTRLLHDGKLANPVGPALVFAQEIAALATTALAHGGMDHDYWIGIMQTMIEMANVATGGVPSPTVHLSINDQAFGLHYEPMKITVVDPLTP